MHPEKRCLREQCLKPSENSERMAEEAPKGLGPSRPDAMGPKSLWQAPSGPRRAVKRARSEETNAAPAPAEPAAMETAAPPETAAPAPAEAAAPEPAAPPPQPEPAAMETEPPPPPPPPGSRITVRFSDGQDYGGTITELLDEHRAMVLYDDGQSEAVRFPDSDVKVTRVGPAPAPSLEVTLSTPAPAPVPAAAPAAAPPADAAQSFEDGDRVEARFGFGKQWYGGRITGGSALIGYDVVYDDGDRESGVAAELIRPIIREFVEMPPEPPRPPPAVEPAGEDDFVGIYRKSKTANWEAGIKVNGERMHLGTYDSPEAAARAYDEKARAHGRPVNFPRDGEQQAKKQRKRARTAPPASPPQHILFGSPLPEEEEDGFVGIWRAPGARKPTWKSSITVAGEKVHLGSFSDPISAAQAYDAKAREQGRPVNFPRDGEVKAEKNQRRARPAAAPSPRPPAPSPRAPRVAREVDRLRLERDDALAQLAHVRGQLEESRRYNDKLLAVFLARSLPPHDAASTVSESCA